MANTQLRFHNASKHYNNCLSIDQIESKAKLIVRGYFLFSQQMSFINADKITSNIIYLVISYFGINIYDLNIKKKIAVRIWLTSYDAGNIYNALLHLMYADLVKLFREITGINKRYPKHSEIKPFFIRHGGVTRTDGIQSIHCSKFDEFIAWFIGICYIIKDLIPYYKKLDDPLNCLFYDRKTSENSIGTKYGRFILRLSSNINCLVISYVNQQHRIKHICLKRLQNALYQIGNNGHNKQVELINGFIKPWSELEYLFMEYKDERKSLIFGSSPVNYTTITNHKYANTDTQLDTNIQSISRNNHIKSTSINHQSKLAKKPMDVNSYSLLRRDSIELPTSSNNDDEKKQSQKDNASNSYYPTINQLPPFRHIHYQQQGHKSFHQRCNAFTSFNYQQTNNVYTAHNATTTHRFQSNNTNISHLPPSLKGRGITRNNINARRDDQKSNNIYSPLRLQRMDAVNPSRIQQRQTHVASNYDFQPGHLIHPMSGIFRRNIMSESSNTLSFTPVRRPMLRRHNIYNGAHRLNLVLESHSNFTDPESDIDIEFEVNHYDNEPKWLKELHNYDNKTKLIVCGYFRVSQTELFSNLYIIPWMIVYICILYYNLSINDINIKDKIAAEIWVHSIRNENENIIEFHHLYPNLIYSFKQFTECKGRHPSFKQIVEFFMKNGGYYHSDFYEHFTMNSSPVFEQLLIPSIEINEFHKFYQWFISMCRIITDLKVIYERTDDPLTGLFYENITATIQLKHKPEGAFLLRLSEANELMITYKNHNREIKDELLIRISKGSYTVAKTGRDVKLLKFIRNEQTWKYLYTPNKLLKKKQVF